MDPDRYRANQPTSHSVDSLANLPLPPPTRYGSKPKANKPKWWVGVVILVVVSLGLIVWAVAGHYTHQAIRQGVAKRQAVTKAAPATPPAASIPTSSHTAAAYAATFNYPTSWTVVDSGSAPLTVTSPVISLTSATGQTTMGQVVMTLAKQATIPSAFSSSSVAVLASQKIAFTQPAPTQAADTYLSFVQYPATTTKGGLDGIYVSGNYGYQQDQVIPSSNIAQVNPLVYFTFYACSSSICPLTSRLPLTISSTEWNDRAFSAPIQLVIKSFTFN